MNVFELFGQVKLDGVSAVKSGLSETEAHTKKVTDAMKIMGAAFTAVGVAGLKLVGDARKMNATLGQTAITLGITTKEMRDLAKDVTDVTFPLENVTKTFDLLARAGVKNTSQLKDNALAFDTLGDAIGMSADEVANILIPAYKMFGDELPTTAAEMDKWTWLVRNSSIELSELGSVMGYVATYGQDLNLTSEDLVVVMKALSEKGLGAAEVTRLLRGGINEAEGSVDKLYEILGLTNDEIALYSEELAGATGITAENKKVMDEQYGIMDKLKAKFDEITLSAGSFLTPLEPILALMTALGPAMIVLSSATAMHTISLTAHAIASGISTAAQWALNAAMSANPIGLIILAIAGLITGLVLLVKNWDWVKEKMTVVWEFIGNIVKFQINMIIGYFNGMMWAIEKVINFIGDAIRSIPAITIPDWVPAPFGGKSFKIPAPPAVELPRIPLLDSGGLVEGPGVFAVGEGVKEVVRSPAQGGDIHIHVGNFLGTETELRVFVRKIKEVLGEDERRSAFGQVNKDFYYGRSAP